MVLEFLFVMNSTIAISIFALIIIIIINFFYKFLVNQNEAKAVKERTKELRKQMQKFQKEGQKDKASSLMSEMLVENNRLMKLTLKPMLVSFVIIIIILPGLNTFYADVLIGPDSTEVVLAEEIFQISISGNTLQIGDIACNMPCKEVINERLYNIQMEGENIKFAQVTALLPVTLPFVDNDLGWLGWYILVSMPLAIIIRRVMKISI